MQPARQDGDPDAFIVKLVGNGANDMCSMGTLTRQSILKNLRLRFQSELVYTYVGDIVLSVNPFKNVGCVGKAIRARYMASHSQSALPPHIYALVHMAYNQMRSESMSQSILISGESGAGKTEAMKVCLAYLGELSSGPGAQDQNDGDVAKELAQTNPVMEAMGNAKVGGALLPA
jgi:myosin heavy subunit